MTATDPRSTYTVGKLKVESFVSADVAARVAAEDAAHLMCELSRDRESVGVVFATGASQLAILDALVARDDVPWGKIVGMHLDEYVGISPEDPGSFRHYLAQYLTRRVPLRAFHAIDGDAHDAAAVCDRYARLLRELHPEVCLMGIGENGHLAFNDPGVANFADPLDVKVVELDRTCREQQAAEGWFPSPDRVPRQAITLTLPAILRIPHLLASVPGGRKAAIVQRALEEPISTDCPATILREHPGATLYLDSSSAALWERDRTAAGFADASAATRPI
jgi:glucosamine-6-phosphate deaminase